jgi:hypothetical protein
MAGTHSGQSGGEATVRAPEGAPRTESARAERDKRLRLQARKRKDPPKGQAELAVEAARAAALASAQARLSSSSVARLPLQPLVAVPPIIVASIPEEDNAESKKTFTNVGFADLEVGWEEFMSMSWPKPEKLWLKPALSVVRARIRAKRAKLINEHQRSEKADAVKAKKEQKESAQLRKQVELASANVDEVRSYKLPWYQQIVAHSIFICNSVKAPSQLPFCYTFSLSWHVSDMMCAVEPCSYLRNEILATIRRERTIAAQRKFTNRIHQILTMSELCGELFTDNSPICCNTLSLRTAPTS